MDTEYFILYAEYNTITKIYIQQEVFVESDLAVKKCLSMQKENPEQRFFIKYKVV